MKCAITLVGDLPLLRGSSRLEWIGIELQLLAANGGGNVAERDLFFPA